MAIPGVIASEESAHLQPQPPIMDPISGAVVISGGTVSGSNSVVQVSFTPNPLGHPATSFSVTAFSGAPLVAVTGTTVTGATSPLTITYPFAANALYEFRGTATNSHGTSQYGNQSNQVEPFIATPTPSGLNVSVTDTTDVQFTFYQIPSASGYLLSANGSYTNPTTGITTNDSVTASIPGPGTPPTVTSTLTHGYLVGMPYEFSAQSQNFAGTSASGANIQLTPNPFGPPLAPTFTASPNTGNSQISVTITPDTNPLHNLPSSYSIYDTTGGFGSVTTSGTSIVLHGSANPIDPISTISVAARNTYGTTYGTNQVIYFPPAAPSSVTATVASSGTGWDNSSASCVIDVSWSQTISSQYSSPTNYYVLAQGTDGSTVSTNTTGTSAILSGSFNANIAYTITVTAQNSGGSATGTAGSTLTPYTVVLPGAITGLSATVIGTSTVSLSWTNPSSGGPYDNVTISTSPSASITPTTVTSGTSTQLITGSFAIGQSYTFSVYTQNAAGSSTPSTSSVTPNPKATITATNATHASDATYDYLFWEGSGSLSIANATLNSVQVMAVGGGGGGGAFKTITTGVYEPGGGGGAGQVLVYTPSSYSLSVQNYDVLIGAGGGAGSSSNGGTGGSTTFQISGGSNLFTVNGGGGGGFNGNGVAGANGGGGAGNNFSGGAGNNASTGQSSGYSGGNGSYSGGVYYAGGGGGAGGAGAGGSSTKDGGNGITANDWGAATGTGQNVSGSYYYGGGGGGGAYSNSAGTQALGGNGGGGYGGSQTSNIAVAANGTTGTGGGGGGAGGGASSTTAGAGGSGIFIMRWPLGTATIGSI